MYQFRFRNKKWMIIFVLRTLRKAKTGEYPKQSDLLTNVIKYV